MGDPPRTVAELLSLDSDAEVADAALMASEGMGALLKAMGALVPAQFKQSLVEAVGSAVPKALNLPLEPILTEGWNKIPPLLKYRDAKRYPPGDVNLVALGEPTVAHTLHPRIELLLNQQTVKTYSLDLVLSLEFETAVLRIENAKIRAVETGNCTGKAKLEYEGKLLYERATKEFKLPGSIPLGEGLSI
jgi:hypothetical protein